VSDPFVFRDNATKEWGLWYSVDVDGDLALLDSTSLFRRNGSKWTELYEASFRSALSNGTIAVYGYENNHDQVQLYEYNEGQDTVLPIQDPIIPEAFAEHLALSNGYLVYSHHDIVFVYQRSSVNQTSVLQQKLALNANSIWDDWSYTLTVISLHDDKLVVATPFLDQTHIFVEHNGRWVELTVLDQDYLNVAVSGQNLIASTHLHRQVTHTISKILKIAQYQRHHLHHSRRFNAQLG
jgi:hypothetical protein